jgi:hypothetical protein
MFSCSYSSPITLTCKECKLYAVRACVHYLADINFFVFRNGFYESTQVLIPRSNGKTYWATIKADGIFRKDVRTLIRTEWIEDDDQKSKHVTINDILDLNPVFEWPSELTLITRSHKLQVVDRTVKLVPQLHCQ